MDLPHGSTTKAASSGTLQEPEVRLYGRWLLIARVSWIVITLFLVILNIVMIPRYDALLQANCQPGPQCFAIKLTSYDRTLLHQFGLSVGLVATYQVALDAISVLVCCAVGALIFWRKSADRMALFCAFGLVLFGSAGFTSILSDTLAPLSTFWFMLVGILDLLGQSGFMIFFLLFPSGRFVPRWMRWVTPCVVLYWTYTIFWTNQSSQFDWPILVFFALLLCIVGAQVYRYRSVSTARERQQTKWVVSGISVGIVGFILAIILGSTFHALEQSSVLKTLVAGSIVYGFLLLIPISIAIAILRSRLYDIDVIINKALVYGTLSALLAAVYAGLIIGSESLFGLFSRQGAQPPVIVVSTLVIAALFQPLRNRIQRLIDRRFYRRKYNAARTLEAFSATLRNEVDLATLRDQLLSVVEETMQPAHVSLWLRQSAQSKTHRFRPNNLPSEEPL